MALSSIIISALLLLCGLAQASHIGSRELSSIPATVVDNKYKTGYHFQPPKHWINDPNGPMYYNGIYHLFYQYNPYGSVWGNIVWAHSISLDLVNWISIQPAIFPSKPFDIYGCWSGSATILDGNKPAILYTGIIDQHNTQVQIVAYPKNLSDPYLTEWDKPDYNPVIKPESWMNATQFRDPTTAWKGPDKKWRIVVGSKKNNTGMAVLYRSRDFVKWTRAKYPLHAVNDTGMWECPDFYPVDTVGRLGLGNSETGVNVKYVLKNSLDLTRFEYYTIGKYDHKTDRYVPDRGLVDSEAGLRYDYGNFYASKTFFDEGKRRRILWGWSNESDSKQNDVDKGWAGVQTIPREIWLDSNGKQLVQWPVKELETLRGKEVGLRSKKLKSGSDAVEISGIRAAQADVEVKFQLSNLKKAEAFEKEWSDAQKLCEEKGTHVKGGVGPFGLLTLASSKKEEYTSVFFRIFKAPNKYVALMCHDPSRSSLSEGLYKPTYGGFVNVDIKKNGMISLRSLIDHSVVESFGGEGRTCMTSRVYPSMALGDKARLFVFNYGQEDVKVSELRAWEMEKPLMNENPY